MSVLSNKKLLAILIAITFSGCDFIKKSNHAEKKTIEQSEPVLVDTQTGLFEVCESYKKNYDQFAKITALNIPVGTRFNYAYKKPVQFPKISPASEYFVGSKASSVYPLDQKDSKSYHSECFFRTADKTNLSNEKIFTFEKPRRLKVKRPFNLFARHRDGEVSDYDEYAIVFDAGITNGKEIEIVCLLADSKNVPVYANQKVNAVALLNGLEAVGIQICNYF